MKVPEEELPRQQEQDAGVRALPAWASAAVAAARQVPSLDAAALARIKRGVLAPGPTRGFVRLPVAASATTVALLLLGVVATATGTGLLWRRYAARAATPPAAPAPHELPRQRRPRAAAPIDEPPALPSAPEILPAPEMPRGASPDRRPVTRARSIALANPPPAPQATPETEPPRASFATPEAPAPTNETEARLLARAIERLRRDRDPRGALELLDRYGRSFPHGVLEAEALLARIEATLAMGDRSAALALLDGRRGFSGRLGADLLLARAELRAGEGRYAEALSDFDELLRGPVPPLTADSEERARYGRAVSLGHLGQATRAQAELAAYRQRFPQGKFATEVERLLTHAP